MAVDYRKSAVYAKVLVALPLLLLLHLPGVSREISGAKRWFKNTGASAFSLGVCQPGSDYLYGIFPFG